MRILVTGSTGFIGGALCRALIDQGHHVIAFHRSSSTLKLLDDLPVEHVVGNVTQPETLLPAMEDVEVVFHLASVAGIQNQPGRLYTTIVEGTRNVLHAAQRTGVKRVVHTSSVFALGVPEKPHVKQQEPARLDESHTWNLPPDSYPYGYAKYLAEMEVQKAVAKGLDVVIVNPCLVIGPGDIYRQSSSWIVQVSRQRLPAIMEGGINVVHIADVVTGHLAALKSGMCGVRYILAGENISYIQFVKKIAAIAGVPAPALVLPSGLVRSLSNPLRWFQSFIPLQMDLHLLHLAGHYLYYTSRKAQEQLNLPAPQTADRAISDAYRWFIQMGTIPAKKQPRRF